MKLDYNLMRDVMLVLEELDYGELLTHKNCMSYPRLSRYNIFDILYVVQKMKEGKLIDCGYVSWTRKETPSFDVKCLTWQGHQYLETIRTDSVWKNVMEKMSIGLPLDAAISAVIKVTGSLL